MRVDVVDVIPVRSWALMRHACGIDRCVQCPGMDFNQRIVEINESDFLAVAVQCPRKELLMHEGAGRALKIVEANDCDGRLRIPTSWTPYDVDGKRGILVQIEGFKAAQLFVVRRNQEVDIRAS